MHRSHSRHTERGKKNAKAGEGHRKLSSTANGVMKKMHNKKRRQYKDETPSI